MDQDINQAVSTRRFIFSDDFYDQLDAEPSQEQAISFDVPVMPSIIETKKEEPVIENKDVNVPLETIETPQPKIEEPIQFPSFEFKKPEELTIESEPTIDLIQPEYNNLPPIQTPPEDNILPQKFETNKLDVETGINTELENELMMTNIKPHEEIIQNQFQNDVWVKPHEEKMVYRAKRTNFNTDLTNLSINQNIKINDIETIKEEPIYTEPYVPNIQITERDINPPIINIDEEIEKENELTEDIPVAIVVEEEVPTDVEVVKSDLLNELRTKEQQTGKISILARYGEDFCSRDYITNPAIGRSEEIKQLILILLTPEKSGILVGKPGIGKTSIVEGLAYHLQRNQVPDALKGYRIVSVKTSSLLGTLPTGETKLQTLVDELKELDKIILFVDEIHMLMGATDESSLDFANMFKESLGRGSIKMIGATTNDEYERYVLRDKAFVRRFQRVDVQEPDREQTIRILMGTLPKIEKNTGAKLKYTDYIKTEIMAFIVDITTEYKRIYGIGSRYPDICLTLLSQAFSQAVFDNRKEVNIIDIRNAIENSKNIYPDVIRKELINFDEKFKQIINEEKAI